MVADDLNGDGATDLVASDWYGGVVAIVLANGAGGLQVSSYFDLGAFALAAGDVSGDQIVDIVAATADGVRVLLGNGSGGFGAAQAHAQGTTSGAVLLSDFTNDGLNDIAFTDVQSQSLYALYGLGSGAFSEPVLASGSGSAASMVADDFDDDGWMDVASVNNGASIRVLRNDQQWTVPLPLLFISDSSVVEGNSGTANATFTLTLSRASEVDVSVQYSTANNTASSGSDYTTASGTVIIAAGQLSRTVTVAILGDRIAESTETFSVNLTDAANATIADGQGIGAIEDNEPRISIGDVTRSEGKKGGTTLFTFVVTLSGAYDQTVSVSYQTVNGTATTSNNDYVARNGTLTFAPGEITKTITVEVKGDTNGEPDEVFYVDLFGNSGNSLIAKSRGVGTITNDDRSPVKRR